MTARALPPEFDYPKDWPRCGCGRPVLDGHLTCGDLACNELLARKLARETEPNVFGGQFYGVTDSGKMIPVGETAPWAPDAWICRRVVDYPGQRVPKGGHVAPCSKCGASIVFNPEREVKAPKICMQCARIMPCPIES